MNARELSIQLEYRTDLSVLLEAATDSLSVQDSPLVLTDLVTSARQTRDRFIAASNAAALLACFAHLNPTRAVLTVDEVHDRALRAGGAPADLLRHLADPWSQG